MATSTLDNEYRSLKRNVCIQKREFHQYEALKNTIKPNDKDAADRKVQEIVTMTKRFAMALMKNTGRTTTYCGDIPERGIRISCQTLPYNRNWDKDEETTRNFIPTTYHILQEYDLLYLKAKISLEKILEMGDDTIADWTSKALSDIKFVGKEINDTDEKIEYYNSCISTIEQVIFLRKYDMYTCHNGIDTDSHTTFIEQLMNLSRNVVSSKPIIKSLLPTRKISQGERKRLWKLSLESKNT